MRVMNGGEGQFQASLGFSFTRGVIAASLCILSSASVATATTLEVRPINFIDTSGYSMIATGSITTGLDSNTLSDWNLKVTTTEQLAHYTKSNTTKNVSDVGVSADGQSLNVHTSADPANVDGGLLSFRAANPFIDFGVALADFTGPSADGGQAMYMAGSSFDAIPLNQSPNQNYTVAELSDPASDLFNLVPLSFSNGVTLEGTITTDGTVGSLSLANIIAWDIYVTQTTIDIFTPGNSSVSSYLLAASSDGLDITVDNPEGYLTFTKGAVGGHPYALQLADFSDPSYPGGRAAYYQGRFAVTTLDLGARRGPWTITGTDPIVSTVPVPATMPLLASGLAGLGFLARWRRLK